MQGEGVNGPLVADRYSIIGLVGRGGYSNVYKALDVETNNVVALKYIKTFSLDHSVPQSFYRENKVLRDPDLQSENMLKLWDVVDDNGTLVMVLEYCEFDLSGLTHTRRLSVDQVRGYGKQLFEAVQRMHAHHYVHRDLKPANVLVTRDNKVKLADFGLSRVIRDDDRRPLTEKVVTPCYRSPELLLGDINYGSGVDIWSLGCVLYEMITGKVLFKPGTSSAVCQLDSIFKVCGTPTSTDWPGIDSLPNTQIIQLMRKYPPILDEILDSTLPQEFAGAKELIMSMLQMNPAARITIDQALAHPFFSDKIRELPELSAQETHACDVVRAPRAVVTKVPCLVRLGRILPPMVVQ